MKLKQSSRALRVLGSVLLAVAAVRFAMGFFGSIQASEFGSLDAGFAVKFSTDFITLALGAVGVLLCVLSFHKKRSEA
jgi:mannose/fructose/N-acetylgalactosamine-specific phosphotransferase system component IIC